MAFTLGMLIILVPLGVAFPALVLIANFIGLKRKDLVAHARRTPVACIARPSIGFICSLVHVRRYWAGRESGDAAHR